MGEFIASMGWLVRVLSFVAFIGMVFATIDCAQAITEAPTETERDDATVKAIRNLAILVAIGVAVITAEVML